MRNHRRRKGPEQHQVKLELQLTGNLVRVEYPPDEAFAAFQSAMIESDWCLAAYWAKKLGRRRYARILTAHYASECFVPHPPHWPVQEDRYRKKRGS